MDNHCKWLEQKLAEAKKEASDYWNALRDVTYSASHAEAKQAARTALDAYDPFAPKEPVAVTQEVRKTA